MEEEKDEERDNLLPVLGPFIMVSSGDSIADWQDQM